MRGESERGEKEKLVLDVAQFEIVLKLWLWLVSPLSCHMLAPICQQQRRGATEGIERGGGISGEGQTANYLVTCIV